ncbi:unnamed protein product [marine sediment metagenome]|uniref:Uncharacterized protein n=1 Tax=marine sediment metagenome TaxID=412755 RepID=X1KCL8_9ZZZZ
MGKSMDNLWKTMTNFLKKFLKKEKKDPIGLKKALDLGLISKEEFLRFTIIKKGVSLEKAKTELKNFLKKQKK